MDYIETNLSIGNNQYRFFSSTYLGAITASLKYWSIEIGTCWTDLGYRGSSYVIKDAVLTMLRELWVYRLSRHRRSETILTLMHFKISHQSLNILTLHVVNICLAMFLRD